MRKWLIALIVLPGMLQAQQAKKYGDWATDYSVDGFQIASTTNSSRAVAGIICNLSKDGCEAFINPGISCEDDGIYPMMINSSLGSNVLRMKCMHIGKLQIFVADDFQMMIRVFEGGGEVGFAMPMQSGHFRVFRFSTIGATPAINDARTRPRGNKSNAQTKSDEIL